jgi:non-specific serine/threonine protein kinase
VGRRDDLERARRLLRGSRVITLTGAGGIGKTRLAVEVARRSIRMFPGGIVFVALGAVRDRDLLLPTIGAAIGAGESPEGFAIDALRGRLSRSKTLLVLDNFEQIAGAAPEVSDLLSAFPKLHVMVTSRVPLHISGEQEFQVQPLELPDPARLPSVDALGAIDSVALFVERARSLRPDFRLTDSDAGAISLICRRLDGLPLAIELAAARSKLLSPAALLRRLELGLPALSTGPADAPDRQKTLGATIAWSYELLSPRDQRILSRLGVFVGGSSLAAAEAVVSDASEQPPGDVLEILNNLVEQSLIGVVAAAGGDPRFAMLETIREFALELASDDEAEEVRRRHVAYFLNLAESEEQHERGPDQARWLDRLVADRGNFRAALAYARSRGDGRALLRLGAALDRRFWLAAGDLDLSESRDWLDAGLAMEPSAPPAIRAKALHRLGRTRVLSRARMVALLQESVTLYKLAGDVAGMTEALASLAQAAIYSGDLDAADALLQEGLDLASHGDAGGQGRVELLVSLGVLATRRREGDRARGHFEEALNLARQSGDAWGTVFALSHIGRLTLTGGDLQRATAALSEAVDVARGIGEIHWLAISMSGLASARIATRDLEAARLLILELAEITQDLNWWYQVRTIDVLAEWLSSAEALPVAVRCLAAAERTRAVTEMSWDPDREAVRARLIESSRRSLPHAEFDAAWTRGQAESLSEVLAHGLTAIGSIDLGANDGRSQVHDRHPLSPREIEVLALVAAGRSDGEIATELFISKKTASVHVAHIKDKLGAQSRVEIALAAVRLGLTRAPRGHGQA